MYFSFFLLRDSENDLLHMKHDPSRIKGTFVLHETTVDTYLPCATDGSVQKQKCCGGGPFYTTS